MLAVLARGVSRIVSISLLAGLVGATFVRLGPGLGASVQELDPRLSDAGGWIGGGLEKVVLWGTDLFISLPWLFLLLTVRALLPLDVSPGASLAITFFLLGLLGWASAARVVRGSDPAPAMWKRA